MTSSFTIRVGNKAKKPFPIIIDNQYVLRPKFNTIFIITDAAIILPQVIGLLYKNTP